MISSHTDPESTRASYAQIDTPAALIRTDGAFLILDATPAAAALLGYDLASALIGLELPTFFPTPALFDEFHACLIREGSGRPHQVDATLTDRQGKSLFVRFTVQAQAAADGALAEMQASLVDLSAHQAQVEDLRASELQLRLLVENAQDIIFNIDTATTRITAVNPAFESVTGWACSDWIGKSFTPLIHPDDLALALKILRDAVTDKVAPTFELRVHARPEKYVTLEFSTALHQRDSEVTQWLGIARDITARKQAEAATKRYLQRLQTLHKIDRAVLLVQSPEEVAFVALSHLANLVTCDYASIMLLDFEADEVEIVTEYRDHQLLLGDGRRLHISDMGLPPQFLQGQPNHIPNMMERENPARPQDEAFLFAQRSLDQQKMRSVLNLPLLSRDVMVGVLTLASYRPYALSDEALEVAQEVANQLAVSLQGVRLLDAEQKARHTAEILGTASMALTQTLQVDIMLERLLDYLHQLVPYDMARVFLLDADTLHLSAARQLDIFATADSPLGHDLSLADYPGLVRILAGERSQVFGDVAQIQSEGPDSDGARWPYTPTMHSWLGIPLSSQGRQLGLCVVEHRSADFFLDQHVRAAEALAAQTAIALANARLLAERQQYASLLEERVQDRTAALKRSNGLIAALSQVATRVQSSLDPQKAIETLGQELQDLLGVTSMVALLDVFSQTLEIRYYTQDERTLEILDRIAVRDPQGGPRLTREHWPLFTDMVDHRRTLFLPDTIMRAYDEFFVPEDPEFAAILAASGITQDIKSIFLPLMMEDRMLGVLLLWGEALQEIDMPAVTIFAGQIATALEMARLHAQVQIQRVEEQEALLRLSQALLREVDVDATNQQALAMIADIFAPDLAAIMLLQGADQGQVVLQAGLGWAADQIGTTIEVEANSIIVQGLRTNRPLVVADMATETRFTIPQLVRAQGMACGISAPMTVGNDQLGVLSIFWRSSRPVTGDESRLLALIGNTTAQSIARARLYEAEQQARRVADILRTANMTLTQSLDLPTVLDTLLATIRQLIPFDSANVMLITDDKRINIAATAGYNGWNSRESQGRVSFDWETHQPAARAIRERKGYFIADVLQDPTWETGEMGQHVRGWLCMPLIARGEVLGIFSLDKAEPNFFTQEHLQLAETLAVQAAAAIQNALLYQEVTAGQERLQVLTRRLVDVQEMERSRVARELHEGVGQYLTGLSLSLKASTQAKPEGLHHQLGTAKSIVDELTAQVREMSLALRPTLLDDMGLHSALEWLFERHTKQTNQKIDFIHSDLVNQRFSPSIETAAFRIVQEILIDLADMRPKSALPRATAPGQTEPVLSIRVWRQEDELHLSLTDQGDSSGLAQALGENHISNLYSLQERATLLGGSLTLETTEAHGLRLEAFFPLPAATENAANPGQ